jgi:alkylhydroperoxidase family enzyme
MRWSIGISAAALSIVVLAIDGSTDAGAQTAAPPPATQASKRPATNKLPAIEPTTEEQKQTLGRSANGSNTLNAFKTCLNNVELCKPWMAFTGVVGRTLPIHDRELLILRTAWLCGNDYTWGVHVDIARQNGFTNDDIVRITQGPKAKGWNVWDTVLVEAADALYVDKLIPDHAWSALDEKYDAGQLMDVVFTVGQYSMISMFVRSAGIQAETGKSGFTDVK